MRLSASALESIYCVGGIWTLIEPRVNVSPEELLKTV